MKIISLFPKLLLASVCLGVGFSQAAPGETPAQRDKRMQWWRDAKFGMFIHYGLYSGLAGELNGKKYDGGAEWIQSYSGTDSETYAQKTLPLFKPDRKNIRAWADLAREAGCKYAVLTSKHHEGFSLFDSKVSDFTSMKAAGMDVVKEFAASCRKNGLKVGLYHSVIDWHHPDYDRKLAKGLPYPKGNTSLEIHAHPDHAKYQNFLHAQVDELLTRYGKLDILWWDYSSRDFDGDRAWRASGLLEKVHARQPGIICNNRLYASNNTAPLVKTDHEHGDFTTPEQYIPPQGIDDDWEVCMTLNGTWGYAAHNHRWKSHEELIRGLTGTVSKGGNFLLNIGPRADGSLPKETVDSFKAIGAWMHVNGEAIYGTQASPFKNAFPWGVVTRKGNTLYLIMYHLPKSGKIALPYVMKGAASAAALADGRAVPVRASSSGVELDVSGVKAMPSATVVRLAGKGTVLEGAPAGRSGK